jgi:hypothetical protein
MAEPAPAKASARVLYFVSSHLPDRSAIRRVVVRLLGG